MDIQKTGDTGREIFLVVADKLQELKMKQTSIYKEIENDAESILDYGKSIG